MLHRLLTGERVVHRDLALSTMSDGKNPFTTRERDVLRRSLDGASFADFANQLYLFESTVRNHLSTAIQSLTSRIELGVRALHKKWTGYRICYI